MRGELQRFYEPLPIGILVLDGELKTLYTNPAYRVLLGMGETPPSDFEDHRELVRLLARFRNQPFTIRIPHADIEAPPTVCDGVPVSITLHGEELLLLSVVPYENRGESVAITERDNYCFGRLQVNIRSGVVRYDEKLVPLSGTEFRLLSHLCRNANQLLTKQSLLRDVWGSRARHTRTVDMTISRLRRKLCEAGCQANYIVTQYGRGYLLALDERVDRT